MAYGRIYIDNLRNKVTALFDELRADNRLCEDRFIEEFKKKYPKDYAMLQYEWEFKVHEFKKNRKGNPKTHPIRPERILSNMYRNYYYKLIKKPAIVISQKEHINLLRLKLGKVGYSIKRNDEINRYDIVSKRDKSVECSNLTFGELSKMFSKGIAKGINQINKIRKEAQR